MSKPINRNRYTYFPELNIYALKGPAWLQIHVTQHEDSYEIILTDGLMALRKEHANSLLSAKSIGRKMIRKVESELK